MKYSVKSSFNVILLFLVSFICFIFLIIIKIRYDYLAGKVIRGQNHSIEQLSSCLKTGDLLLTRNPKAPTLRKFASGSYFTHVEMIYRDSKSQQLLSIGNMGVGDTLQFVKRPLQSSLDEYRRRDIICAVRSLSVPLTTQQLGDLDRWIAFHESRIGSKNIKFQRNLGVVRCFGKRVFNELFLNPLFSVNDAHFVPKYLCTDFVAWLLTRMNLIKPTSPCVSVEFFATCHIDRASVAGTRLYDSTIHFIN